MRKRKTNIKGISIIEILVVSAIFVVLGVISVAVLSKTLGSARKSDSLIKVRENIEYSFSVMERNLRNSESVTCPNPNPMLLTYIDEHGNSTSFSCVNVGASGYIASASARLTSDTVAVTSCSIACTQADLNSPPRIQVDITASDAVNLQAEKGSVTLSTDIIARNY